MQGSSGFQLLIRCFPVTFAGAFQHDGCHSLECGGIDAEEVLVNAQLILILYIHSIQVIEQFFVHGRRTHDVPAEDVAEDFAEHLCRTFPAFHPLLYKGRVQDGGTCLYGNGLFGILHAAVGPVAVVCHIGIRFLAGHGFDGERESTRKFVYMIQGDGAPCVTLTGLDDNIRFGQCRGKQTFLDVSPIFVVPIRGTHIVEVSFGYLLFAFPRAAVLGIGHHTGTVSAVDRSEYTHHRHFTGTFGGSSLFHQ